MAFSYHGVIGHTSKMTLPSVESWANNMNILRDPPRSVHTMKIDKVGETSEITQMIDESGDRICEAINKYSRGVNPMVAVSFDNYGNNGGQRTGGIAKTTPTLGAGSQSFLPYRIMNGGAFRPPIRPLEELLPLSRQPVANFSRYSNPSFVDFTKKLKCESNMGIKKPEKIIKTCIQPRAVYKIETPIIEPYEVKNAIQNPINVIAKSGIKTLGKVTTYIGKPTKEISNGVSYDMYTSKGNNNLKFNSETNIDKSKYIQDTIDINVEGTKRTDGGNIEINLDTSNVITDKVKGDYNVNINDRKYVTNIDDILLNKTTKDELNINVNTIKNGNTKQDYISTDIELVNKLPVYSGNTNITKNIYVNNNATKISRELTNNIPQTDIYTNHGSNRVVSGGISNREYDLRPTINYGEFESKPSMPNIVRTDVLPSLDTQRTEMSKLVYDMQRLRN